MRIREPAVEEDIFCLVSSFHGFVDQLNHDIRPFTLSHDPSLSCKRAPVVFLCLSKDIFLLGRSQERKVDRDKRAAIRPAKGHHAKALFEFHADMVKDLGCQLCLLISDALIKGIINDETVHTIF